MHKILAQPPNDESSPWSWKHILHKILAQPPNDESSPWSWKHILHKILAQPPTTTIDTYWVLMLASTAKVPPTAQICFQCYHHHLGLSQNFVLKLKRLIGYFIQYPIKNTNAQQEHMTLSDAVLEEMWLAAYDARTNKVACRWEKFIECMVKTSVVE